MKPEELFGSDLDAMPKPAWHHDKRTRQERGYGAAWDRIRPIILKRDGYRCQCEDCKTSGILKPATHVDHVVSKADWMRRFGKMDGCDAPSNLRAINKTCHEKKSLVERGYRVPVKVGADGFPIE